MPGVEGQGTDKEQKRQDGLVAPDVKGPPTVDETNTEVSNKNRNHKENNSGGLPRPTTVLGGRS